MDKRLERKEKERQFKTELIISAFKKIIKRKSWHEITLKDIAEEAGFGKATIYSYFDSKEDIFLLLIQEALDKHYEFIEKLKKEDISPEEKIRRFSQFKLDIVKKTKKEYGSVEIKPLLVWLKTTKEGTQYKKIHNEIVQFAAYIVDFFTEVFDELKAAGYYDGRSARSFAHYYVNSIHSIMSNIFLEFVDEDIVRDMIDTLHYLLFRGHQNA